ncbi:MAG: ABC transporter ATP-binding protein [Clostridiales bacterium]|mgnify:CR=1 FL=1|nr:ABC transporter ATP-binding protein [Clostridiales bacterium]MDY2834676.1 ABC transporter ATP-binding protein [Candidatus Aphodomonas sp.]
MLKINGISTFYGKVQALNNVSLEVNEEEIVSIIGANGAGKSSLMRSIMGIVHPQRGTISFKGEDITRTKTNNIVQKGIVYVPEGREVFTDLTVEENLEMGAFSKKFTVHKLHALFEEMYATFPRLKERRHQPAGTLSGGEQQMLAIARGMMSEPELIMFDEPSLGLAPVIVDEMFDVISSINQKKKIPVILVEQNAFAALNISSRCYVLENGVVMTSGNSRELAESPEIKKAYLGG